MGKLTKLSLGVVLILWLGSLFYYHSWKENNALLGDAGGYYLYLPAVFIQHDLHDLKKTVYEKAIAVGVHRDSTQEITDVGEVYFYNGHPVIKYTCGIAIMESPAFLMARLIAKTFKYPDTGFSLVFVLLLHVWNLFIAFAGLYLLSKLLSIYFIRQDAIIALTVLALALGTNLYHFVVYNIGMSHAYLFALYAILLYSTNSFYKKFSLKHACTIGLSAGMITLIRPNEIICLFIPFLYGVQSIPNLKQRAMILFHSRGVYFAVFIFGLCALPQLFYWKSLTGHWVYYSYANEGFDFLHPQIFSGLFKFKNGWLPYTPIMIFALLGIPVMLFKKSPTALATLVFLPTHIYIIYSWWCWNYINGLGSRPMVETYALLIIPLAVISELLWKNFYTRLFWCLAIVFFVAQQIMMTWQTSQNMLWSEDSNWSFYKSTIFKTHLDIDDVICFDTNEIRPRGLHLHHNIFVENYNDSIGPARKRSVCKYDSISFLLDSKINYTPALQKPLGECNVHPLEWIKISFDNCNLPPSASLGSTATMCVEFNRKGKILKWTSIRIQNKLQYGNNCGIWIFPSDVSGEISFYTQVPKNVNSEDVFKVYGSNFSSSPVAINHLRVDCYTLK